MTNQVAKASSLGGSRTGGKPASRAETVSEVAAVEARKAGIERRRALQIPSPPRETGREAWSQAVSFRETS